MAIKDLEIINQINITKRICIMGIGNFDRADDYAGVAVVEQLTERPFPENITIINAGPVPEAFTGVIKQFKPDILIIIDATLMEGEPGTIKVFSEETIELVPMVTAHQTPMTTLTKYLKYFLTNLETFFIGIQPASLRYAEPMSIAVQTSVNILREFIERKFALNEKKS